MNKVGSAISEIPYKFKSAHYQLFDKIGQGGFGQVYRGEHLNTGQIVAIKFLTLSPDFDEDKRHRYIARFHRETQLNSRLSHPNIVRLLDKGCVDNDLIYAVFEYIEGQSLKDFLLEKGALRPIQAVNVMSQVLDSLAHAHERGVIHRDLKPANIMLMTTDVNHHVKILDFGIGALTNEARQADDQSITLTQETLGTPSYSAPEQLRGEPPTVKSDLYVWGLVFLECLTGQAVMSGSNLASIFHKQLSQSNVPIPAVLAGHPVVSLLRRVLNKKAQDRAGIAIDVYHELNKLNFSSLVGNFNALKRNTVFEGLKKTQAHECHHDATQINPDAFAVSGLIERKQISVLCLSLNIVAVNEGGSELEVIDAIHRDQKSQCSDIAVSYGAFHVGSLGDTQLFYFGYPKVTDNDSRLCARTALEIISRLNKCNALLKLSVGIEVQVRMGINTGLVTHYMDAVPEGEAADLAMSLMRHANPQQILCTQTSQQLLENHIEFIAHEKTQNDHFIKNLSIYQLIGERKVEAFSFLRANRTHHDFIGRHQELGCLCALLNQEGGQSAFVSGEAGMGKSRLIFELRKKVTASFHVIAQCLPEHQFNALYPILSLLKNVYSVEGSMSQTRVEQFTSILNQYSEIETKQGVQVLCTWLNLSLPEGEDTMILPVDKQKKILFNVLVILLFKANKTQNKSGVLFVFEDLHWSDPTSLEFVHFLCYHPLFTNGHMSVVMTSRHALPSLFIGLTITSVKLVGLTQTQTCQIIKSLFERQNVAARVLALVCERTDGIPLFIEELVTMLRDKAWVKVLNGLVDFVNDAVVFDIPNTLLDSLQQKLDALVYAKETVQLAACIGREFEYELLTSTANRTEEKVQNDIDELLSHELVYQLRKVKGDSYIFKHALVREAAYASIDTRNRKLFHGLIAQTLAKKGESYAMEVALHFSYAAHFTQASQQGLVALNQLAVAGANAEVLSLGERLLDWIDKVEVTDLQDCLALKFYGVAMSSELVVNSYTSKRAHQWSQAIQVILLRLSAEIKHKEQALCHQLKVVCEFLRFLHLHHSSQYQTARTLGESLLENYSHEEYKQYEVPTLCFLSQNYQLTGHFHHSIETFEKALHYYDATPQQLFMENNTDFKPYCLGMLSLSYLHIDQLDKAIELAQLAVSLSEKGQYQVSCIASHIFYALCMSFKGDDALVIDICERYYQKYFKPENPVFYTHYIDILLESAKGNLEKATQSAMTLCDSDYDFATGWYLHFIAKKMVSTSRIDEAISLMELSYEKSIKNNEMAAFPIVMNTLAWVLFEKEKKPTHRVVSLLDKSLLLAQEQKAYLFVKEAQLLQSKIQKQCIEL